MKVVLIYRRKGEDAYSIEELFHAIAGELRKHVEVIEYETATRWDMPRDIWRLRRMRADIYHLTGDINYLILFLPHKNTILTVHDIGHLLFGLKGFRRWLYKWLWLMLPIRTAGAVTAVSRETRDNIVRHLGVASNRIEVIEDCHSANFKQAPHQFRQDCPVILQVGTKPYKNVPRLIEALRGMRCLLVLIGQLDEELSRKLAECGVAYENYVSLSHEEIYRKYVECDVVSFVSLGEGFGVPIIEAQATGRPVITANISPMRDIAGEGACMVDPLDVPQIREGIRKIVTDAAYRTQIVERGLRNVMRYTPAAISDQYYKLYRRMMF